MGSWFSVNLDNASSHYSIAACIYIAYDLTLTCPMVLQTDSPTEPRDEQVMTNTHNQCHIQDHT